MHRGRKQIYIFRFKSHHVIIMSGQRDPQRHSQPLTFTHTLTHTVSLLAGTAWFKRRVAATFPCFKICPFFKLSHHHQTSCNHMTVFGSVTRLCRLKCWVFLDSLVLPMAPHLTGSLDNHTFNREITVSKHNARPREWGPLSGVGGVSSVDPGYERQVVKRRDKWTTKCTVLQTKQQYLLCAVNFLNNLCSQFSAPMVWCHCLPKL